MSLSVVIVTHNSAGVLEACWRSVSSLLPDARIIVVDNASTDGTEELCGRLDAVTLIVNEVNVGFGRACNQGCSAVEGTHVLFLNPDVVLRELDAPRFVEEIRNQPFGLVAPVLDPARRNGSLDAHWTLELVGHVAGPLRPRELPERPRPAIPRRGRWPAGAALVVARDEFARLGGFDRRFFLYYEDRDLARRYRAAGLPVRFSGALRAAHARGTSSAGNHSGAAVRQAWAYLSWIEYLSTWNGTKTARRAARHARSGRSGVDRALAVLERWGPLSERAGRKRRELAELDRFIQWQSGFGAGTAAEDFCPNARRIVAAL